MTSQRAGQIQTGIETFANTVNDLGEGGILCGLAQSPQRLHDRHAGLEQGVHLPAEEGEIRERNFSAGHQTRPQGAEDIGARLGDDDVDRNNAAVQQLRGDGVRRSGVEMPSHRLTALIASLVLKQRHNGSPTLFVLT